MSCIHPTQTIFKYKALLWFVPWHIIMIHLQRWTGLREGVRLWDKDTYHTPDQKIVRQDKWEPWNYFRVFWKVNLHDGCKWWERATNSHQNLDILGNSTMTNLQNMMMWMKGMMGSILMNNSTMWLVGCKIPEDKCIIWMKIMCVSFVVIVTYWPTLWRMETLNIYHHLKR